MHKTFDDDSHGGPERPPLPAWQGDPAPRRDVRSLQDYTIHAILCALLAVY